MITRFIPVGGRMWVMNNVWERLPKVRALRRQVAELVGTDSVVEVGCGIGNNAFYCRGVYMGVDPDEKKIALARSYYPGKQFFTGRLHEVDFSVAQYDAVLMVLALHELPERERIVREVMESGCRRMLVFDYNPSMGRWGRWRLKLIEPPEVESYWTFDLAGLAKQAGWRVRSGSINKLFSWWECLPPVSADLKPGE